MHKSLSMHQQIILCSIVLLYSSIELCSSFLSIPAQLQNVNIISSNQKSVQLFASAVFEKDSNRTLYDILECSPQATREELKKEYVKLAKILHPDARINIKETGNTGEFSEVAAAWKVLSDDHERRRYDRSLRANEFKSDVEKTASKLSESAAPYMKSIFETIAMPIFRRTSVTTSAVIDISLQQDITNIDLKKTMEEALKAVQSAGDNIRQIELVEKINNLEQRSLKESKMANELNRELKKVTLKRIHYCIHTPKSAISSMDAKYFLEESLNMTDNKSIVGRMLSKRQINTIKNNIAILADVESDFSSKKSENRALVNKENMQQQTLFKAQMKAKAAIKADEKARKALIAAEEQTRLCNQALKESETSLSHIQVDLEKSTEEVNKISNVVGRQQEKIRTCLLKKEMLVLNNNNNKDAATKKGDDPKTSSIEEESHLTLERLKKEEQSLVAESKSIEDRLLRIQSRKEKLKLKISSDDMVLNGATSS